MKFLQHIFRSQSKTQNNHAKKQLGSNYFVSQKLIKCSKSQALSPTKNFSNNVSFDNEYFERIIDVKLGKTDIVLKNKEDKSHMIYEICILTSDFQYTIRKRFSLFYQFYHDIKKQIQHLNIQFPKKTVLVSGTNIEIVTQRYSLLNMFIKSIFKQLKQNKNRVLENKFLTFLSINDQYGLRKGKSHTQLPKNPFQNSETQFSVEDTSISFELRKLNDYNNHQQDILSKIEKYITYKNYKLTNDQIKLLLVGNNNNDLKGILNLSLSSANQIKSLQLLRFLLEYISPQNKSYNDKIYKQFQKLSSQAFNFDYEKVKNNFTMVQFKQVFFIILQLYCQHKMYNEKKILEKYPELINQFQLWKNLYQLNEGDLCKKNSSASNLNFEGYGFLTKPSIKCQKTKSFQITPKNCELKALLFYPLGSADNLDLFSNQKNQKSSFKSNNSTSELTIQQDWQNCKLKEELQNCLEDGLQNKMEVMKICEKFCLKSNKYNKLRIQMLQVAKTMQQCQKLSNNWNKLIYDQRNDPFTSISRIYMKLNGKSKIFKFKKQDEKVVKNDQNFIQIVKKRLESHNSFGKSDKQNTNELLKLRANQYCNGFQQIITIENIISSQNSSFIDYNLNGEDFSSEKSQAQSEDTSTRRVTIELNFEGQQDYFQSQIMGKTCFFLENAIETFFK